MKLAARVRRLVNNYHTLYAWFGLTTLLVSASIWSLASSRLQQGNADQLVDGFLFQNAHTIREALFPSQHTLLLKWPLFWIIGSLTNTRSAYITATVILTVVTVGLFALVLYRINRRPVPFGTTCLALASVLALIPAQVFGGVTAPLNLALLTGRNIEYVFYIGVLGLYLLARNWKSWSWVAASLLLMLLGASDKLFIWMSLGAAALLLALAYIIRQRSLALLAWRWLWGSAVAWVASSTALFLLGKYLVSIVGGKGTFNSFTNWNNVPSTFDYVGKALLLNFGVTERNGGLTIAVAAVNLGLLVSIIYAGYQLVVRLENREEKTIDRARTLSYMLLSSAAIALVAYVITDHIYQADYRYLTICLFAGFVALASYVRDLQLAERILLICGALLTLCVAIGTTAAYVHTNKVANGSSLTTRDQRIAAALQAHPVTVLVGDYWRVYPIKTRMPHASQRILPLAGCFAPTPSLRSGAWTTSLYTHSFAYIVSLLPAGTPFQACKLRMIETVYGHPTSITIIAGSKRNPTEELLFYSNGASDDFENGVVPPRPVSGVPTDGAPMPTGSTITPLADPS